MKKITLIALSIAMLAGCAKEMTSPVTPSEGQKVTLTFEVDTPDSKVAFAETDATKLEWTGNETMTLVFGKPGADGATYNPENKITIPSTSAGIFSGEVTIPSGFTIADLQAVVVPSECEPYFSKASDTESRLIMPVPSTQVVSGIDAVNWQYVPFFYDLSTASKEESSDNNYTFSGLELKSASDLVRFNVYGASESDEKLVSVSFSINDTGSSIAGNTQWTLGSTGTGINNGGGAIATVSLEVPATITLEGVKVYAAFLSKNNRVISDVIVKTDKATYVKTYDSGNVTLPKTDVSDFCIHSVGLDLSTFTRISGEGKYSADKGATWSNELPETFTSLSVRYDVSSDELTAIASAIKAQKSPVDLDMSGSIYVSKIFPAVFKATSSAKNTTLKSMKFPANVVTITASAFEYCSTLESVELDRIVNIGNSAFRYSGLKSVRIDKQVTKMGTYCFGNCYDLEEAYFNVLASKIPSSSGTNNVGDWSVFRWAKDNKIEKNVDFVLTIGPDSTIPRYALSDNHNIVKLILEYNGADDRQIFNNALNRTLNLHTVICKGTKGLMWAGIGTGYKIGSNYAETKYLVVPDGCSEAYKKESHISDGVPRNLYHQLCEFYGFTLIEQSEYNAL